MHTLEEKCRSGRKVWLTKGPDDLACVLTAYSHYGDLCVYELLSGRRDKDDCFPVPDELMASFQAGEAIEPILDWLIEQYGHEQPWLERCVRKLQIPESCEV
jgi:hypothetical protein